MQTATQIWNPAIGATSKWYMRWMPSLTDLAFLLPAFFLFGRLSGSSIHWLARPHLISWIFSLGFLHLIQDAQAGNRKRLLWLPALMLLWVNLHGGFFLGLVLLLSTAMGKAAEAFWIEGRSLFECYR